MPLLGALHREACVPTEHAKALHEILDELTASDAVNPEPSACTIAQRVCQKIKWGSPKEPSSRYWNDPSKDVPPQALHELRECRIQLIAHLRGGLLLYLRLITELAAASTVNLKYGRYSRGHLPLLEELDSIALVDTLEHYKALSSDDLWFLMRRSAADARDRKNCPPGGYLSRWRRLTTDIFRTRNCEIRVRSALQGSLLPVELKNQILRSVLELEELPLEINWGKIWSQAKDKPAVPKNYIPELGVALAEEILPEYKLGDGVMVFDPIARQYAWVPRRFGGAVYYGYEPALLYDSFLGCWQPNEKHRAKFGRLIGLIGP